MKKRGQVTVFVILGIVIVVAVVILIYLAASKTRTAESEITASQVDIDSAMREVNELVHSCLEKIGKDAIISAATYGGYATVTTDIFHPDNCFSENYRLKRVVYNGAGDDCYRISYVYPCDDNPSNYCTGVLDELKTSLSGSGDRVIEKCLERYVNVELDQCTKDFRSIRSNGWEVVNDVVPLGSDGTAEPTKYYRTNVVLDPDGGTFFNLQIPRRFSKGTDSFVISDFNYESVTNFHKLIGDLAYDLVKNYALDNGRLRPEVERSARYASFNPSGFTFIYGQSTITLAKIFGIWDNRDPDVKLYFMFSIKNFPCQPGQDPAIDKCCISDVTNSATCYTEQELMQVLNEVRRECVEE
ncbi:MAG: hypothetical protein AABX08_00555 [Nanoarchaeota archaeon]